MLLSCTLVSYQFKKAFIKEQTFYSSIDDWLGVLFYYGCIYSQRFTRYREMVVFLH